MSPNLQILRAELKDVRHGLKLARERQDPQDEAVFREMEQDLKHLIKEAKQANKEARGGN